MGLISGFDTKEKHRNLLISNLLRCLSHLSLRKELNQEIG